MKWKFAKYVPDTFSPMLCESATVQDVEAGLFSPLEWVAEQKIDGVRAVVCGGRIYDRRGKEITEKFPELKGFADEVRDVTSAGIVLDGEIVAVTGEFDDTASRIHLKDKLFIRIASEVNPCKFVVFDCLNYKDDVPNRRKYTMRKGEQAGVMILSRNVTYDRWEHNDRWENTVESIENGEPKDMLELAMKEGWEGIVLKRKDSNYECRRSQNWRKVKLFKEVEHTFTKFEEHPKGITIEDGDGRRVVVNGRQADEVKKELQEKGTVRAEIQFLPQKESTAWRFPSFRGIVKEANNGSKEANK